MNMKRLVLAAVVAAGALGSASAASADVLVTYPPNPFSPPETEYLVQKEAPADVSIIFELNPGPPRVFTSPAAPN